MNGACHAPASSTTCGSVGGAYSSSLNLASEACGARNGAPAGAANPTTGTDKPSRRISAGLDRAWIDEHERDVGDNRADREEHRPGGRAAGHQIQVAGAQRVQHEDAGSDLKGT